MVTNSGYEVYNTVGRNIRKYRKKKEFTQKELAESLLLSESFIAKLESITYQTISIDTLYQIAKKLNTPIQNFFDED